MVEPSLRRPTAVTVIGWIFIAGAVFSLLASSLGLVTFANLYQMRKLLLPPGDGQDPAFLRFVTRYVLPLLGLLLPVSLFVIWAAVQFLKLRPWARVALEAMAWLGAAYILVSGVFWIFIFLNFLFGHPVAGVTPDYPPLLRILFIAVSTLSTIVWLLPVLILIFFLRFQPVRDAFKPQH